MKTPVVLALLLTLTACNPAPITSKGRFDEVLQKLAAATSDEERFYALPIASKEAFNLGRYSEAKAYAIELEALAPKLKSNWNYGNAIHDSNVVLGRLAVKEGRIDDARKHLVAAGHTPGSAQLNSFGPNMSLAKDLLDLGEKDVVLHYFDLCRSFWKSHRGRLDTWTSEVESGKTPDFGANLRY